MKQQTITYIDELTRTLKSIDTQKVDTLKQKIKNLIGTEKTLFVCGNGGSASTASHMVCDLQKTILGKNPTSKKERLRVLSLNDNIPVMSAWANDENYNCIFSEHLKNIGRKGDVLVVITGSGNSKNIIEVVKAAKEMNIETFGLLGFEGGEVATLLDHYILVESDDYGHIEDAHLVINHLITDWLKKINVHED